MNFLSLIKIKNIFLKWDFSIVSLVIGEVIGAGYYFIVLRGKDEKIH